MGRASVSIYKEGSSRVNNIQDEDAYKQMRSGGFLAVPQHTGLVLCADGVALFKSSNNSFWPILLMLTWGWTLTISFLLEYGKDLLSHQWISFFLQFLTRSTISRKKVCQDTPAMVWKLSEPAWSCLYSIFLQKPWLQTWYSTMAIAAVRTD